MAASFTLLSVGLSDVSERASRTDQELGLDGTDLIVCCQRTLSQTTLVKTLGAHLRQATGIQVMYAKLEVLVEF